MPKHCRTCRSTLVNTHPDKLLVVVDKSIADALSRVKVEAPVKTEADTLAGVKVFPDLDTLGYWSIRRLARFDKCRPRVLPTR